MTQNEDNENSAIDQASNQSLNGLRAGWLFLVFSY